MLGCCFGLNNCSQKHVISLEKQESSIYIRVSGGLVGAVVLNICFLYKQSNHLSEKMSKKLDFQSFIHKNCHNTPLGLYSGYETERPPEPLDCVKILTAHGPANRFLQTCKKSIFFKNSIFRPPSWGSLTSIQAKKMVF